MSHSYEKGAQQIATRRDEADDGHIAENVPSLVAATIANQLSVGPCGITDTI